MQEFFHIKCRCTGIIFLNLKKCRNFSTLNARVQVDLLIATWEICFLKLSSLLLLASTCNYKKCMNFSHINACVQVDLQKPHRRSWPEPRRKLLGPHHRTGLGTPVDSQPSCLGLPWLTLTLWRIRRMRAETWSCGGYSPS